jgi:hypothetical protein
LGHKGPPGGSPSHIPILNEFANSIIPVPFGRMKHSIMPLRQILDKKFMFGALLEKLNGGA